ncbi:MAG: L,D-transpeptidase family protein [Sporomusaceae bacterium]|nr:L,D-transpeptidase family protein [Sporomusaceae bacterium]
MTVRLTRPTLFYGTVLLLLVTFALGIVSYDYFDELDFTLEDQTGPIEPSGSVSLVIKVAERILEVYDNGQLIKKYRIAVGKSSTPTPIGEWVVVWKDYNWGSGFGTRWMGLNVPWGTYGIHGTNQPWSIGQFTSHGCIRMRNKDVEELFEKVPIGTTVRIEDRRKKVNRVLKYQMTGPDVAILQLKLQSMGYLLSRADGIFGRSTEDAVKQYQEANGFLSNGIVDKNLAEKLGI